MEFRTRWFVILAAASAGVLAAVLGAAAEEDGSHRFDSRERLEHTALIDDEIGVRAVEASLEEARAELAAAIEADASEEEIARLREEVVRREGELAEARTAFEAEAEAVRAAVDALSPDQVRAFNRSLNNALASRLVVALDSSQLEWAAERELDGRQIQSFTKALEADAMFTEKALAAREAYDVTGDPALLRKAERFDAKAEGEREKFLAKVERFEKEPIEDEVRRDAVRNEMRRASIDTREVERHAARDAAREAARDAARDEARAEARGLARREASAAAKAAAKDAAKEEGRRLAKGQAKRE